MRRTVLSLVWVLTWIPLLYKSVVVLFTTDFGESVKRLLESGRVEDSLVTGTVSVGMLIVASRVFVEVRRLVSVHGLAGAMSEARGRTLVGLTLVGLASVVSVLRITGSSRSEPEMQRQSPHIEQVTGLLSASVVLTRIRMLRHAQLLEASPEKIPVRLSPESVETAMLLVSTEDKQLELTPELNARVTRLYEEVDTKEQLVVDTVDVNRRMVLVRLYGYPLVENDAGNTATFRKARALELLTWLVLNRDRMRRSAARTAMWDMNCTDATFSTVVSDLRRALGEISTGASDEFLPITFSDELPLSEFICSDFDLLVQRRQKFLSDPLNGRDDVISALQGVRDLPFAGTKYSWPDLDGSTTRLVVTAIAAAQEVATWAEDNGDIDALMISTTAGLRLLPGDRDLLKLQRSHLARR